MKWVSIVVLLFAGFLHADGMTPPIGPVITIDGAIKHFKLPHGLAVAGALHDGTYDEEVFGNSFNATVTGLPAGHYTVVIDLAEIYYHAVGKRFMKVASGDDVLADNLDLYATAGFATAHRIKGEITHQDDAIMGPVVIRFTGTKGDAKFNAIHLFDEKGKMVAALEAKDVTDPRAFAAKIPLVTDPVIYLDPKQPLEQRVNDLVRRMSLAEKAGQMNDSSEAIPRLSVPEYHYWNECLHGVARAGIATVFPQAIGLAAAWDPRLAHEEADAIATEGRANFNNAAAKWQHANYYGLTFWTPNINIFRDPRWGRGQETYGEDPYLTAQLGISFITGLQGDDPFYYKALACAKHFAVHSGPEENRESFNATPPLRDLYETYLPQFEMAVKEGHVGSVMASYNALYGTPNSANSFLLTDILRRGWGFPGYVVSDCGAVRDIWTTHHYAATPAEGTALAVKAGLDIVCEGRPDAVIDAVAQHLLTESDVDVAVKRLMTARFRLGMFDPPSVCPYASIGMPEIDSPAHAQLNLKVARESMVLLKNDGLLPLDRSTLKTIAVIGPNAQNKSVLQGNYYGEMSHPVYPLDGIREEAGKGIQVVYEKGCPLRGESLDVKSKEVRDAVQAARKADLVIFVGGIDGDFEGENHDRDSIELPAIQTQLLQALQATGKPVVLVNCSGSAVSFAWAAQHLPAIVQAWYPGGQGGAALADVLFGKCNPGGKLPVTFYEKTSDLPHLDDYSMAHRTYRYFTGTPLYPFGFGLSYSSFQYLPSTLSAETVKRTDQVHLNVPVKNTGGCDGDEIVQVYLRHLDSTVSQPIRSLVAFHRLSIGKGLTGAVDFDIPVSLFRYWSEQKKDYTIDAGKYDLQVGASSSDIRQTLEITVQ